MTENKTLFNFLWIVFHPRIADVDSFEMEGYRLGTETIQVCFTEEW